MNVLKAVLLSKNRDTAMDFGPGFGILLPPLSEVFEKTVALEIDDLELSYCRHILNANAIFNVQLILKSEENEFDDFKGEYFDCIVADNVLEHNLHAKEIIGHLFDILKKGGVLVISLPTENLIYRLFESKKDGHVFRSNREINDLIAYARSMLSEIATFDVLPFWYTRAYLKKEK